jgi:hypothetical protein
MTSPLNEIPLGEPVTFTIERDSIQEGRTFSPDAVKSLVGEMTVFILSQVSKRWEQANEPPTALMVTLQCEVR